MLFISYFFVCYFVTYFFALFLRWLSFKVMSIFTYNDEIEKRANGIHVSIHFRTSRNDESAERASNECHAYVKLNTKQQKTPEKKETK